MMPTRKDQGAVRTRTFSAGEVIFNAEDYAGTIFQITDGVVRLFSRSTDGAETITQFVRAGDFFGELAFSGKSRKYTAVAMNDVMVMEYDVREVEEGMSAFELDMFRSLSQRMDALIDEHSRQPGDLYRKLAVALLDIAEKDGEKVSGGVLVKQRITHEMLAGLIGARRETVSLHLKKMKKADAVGERGNWLFLRPDVLRKLAGEAARAASGFRQDPPSSETTNPVNTSEPDKRPKWYIDHSNRLIMLDRNGNAI